MKQIRVERIFGGTFLGGVSQGVSHVCYYYVVKSEHR